MQGVFAEDRRQMSGTALSRGFTSACIPLVVICEEAPGFRSDDDLSGSLVFAHEHFERDAEIAREAPNHRQRQRAPAAEYLGNAALAADRRDQVDLLQPGLLHAELDGLDRVGQGHRMMLALIGLDEGGQNLEPVTLGRSRRRVKKSIDLAERQIIVGFGLDGANIHGCVAPVSGLAVGHERHSLHRGPPSGNRRRASYAVSASIASYALCVPTNRMKTILRSYRIRTTNRYLLPAMLNTARLFLRMLAPRYWAFSSAGVCHDALRASRCQASNGVSASPQPARCQNCRNVRSAISLIPRIDHIRFPNGEQPRSFGIRIASKIGGGADRMSLTQNFYFGYIVVRETDMQRYSCQKNSPCTLK